MDIGLGRYTCQMWSTTHVGKQTLIRHLDQLIRHVPLFPVPARTYVQSVLAHAHTHITLLEQHVRAYRGIKFVDE